MVSFGREMTGVHVLFSTDVLFLCPCVCAFFFFFASSSQTRLNERCRKAKN